MEEALLAYDPLPHWGKVFSRSHIGARYPMLAAFRRVRDRTDPGGKFSNSWLDDVVFGEQ
jgi:xylitol oxidase